MSTHGFRTGPFRGAQAVAAELARLRAARVHRPVATIARELVAEEGVRDEGALSRELAEALQYDRDAILDALIAAMQEVAR